MKQTLRYINRHTCLKSTLTTLLAIGLMTAHIYGQTRVTAVPIGPQPPVTNPTVMALNPVTQKLYVVGEGGAIAVVDAKTNRTLSHIGNTNGAQVGIFVNPVANRIYLLNVTLQVIDGATDTLVQTVQAPLPPNSLPGSSFFLSGDYNPVTNQLYIVEAFQDLNSLFHTELIAIDGATLAQTAVLINSATAPTQYMPGRIIVDSANNTVYGFYIQGNAPMYYWLFDGATNKQIAGSSCAGTQCTAVVRGSSISGFMVNPLDKMLWLTSDCTPPSILIGGNGSPAPPNYPIQTCVTRLDGSVEPNLAYVPSTIVYGAFAGVAFDPASGRMAGFGACLPITSSPPATAFNVCKGPQTGDTGPTFMPVLFDPLNPSQLIAVNLTGFQSPPSFTNGVSCGLGYSGVIGLDAPLGNIYWDMVDCTGTHPANLVMAKANFGATPTATFPPAIPAPWVANLASNVTGLYGPPFADMTVDPTTHRTFFLDAGEASVMELDPSVPSLTTQQLRAKPAGLAVNSLTNTVYVSDATAGTLTTFTGSSTPTLPQVRLGMGPLVAANPVTNQVVVAGPSPVATDPNQNLGAVLVSGASNSVIMSLPAAATSAVAVNSATNIAYFADTAQWYAVSLQSGSRIFTGSDLSGTGTDICTITSLGVNPTTNRVYVAGKCQTNGQTLAVFDGATNTLLQQVSFGAFVTAGTNYGFGRVAVNRANGKIYLENIRPRTTPSGLIVEDPAVEVFDGTTLAHLTSMVGLRGPMAVNPATNIVYICVAYCAAVDSGTDTTVGILGQSVTSIAVNETTNTIYVTGDVDAFGRPAPGMVTVYQGYPAVFTVSGTVSNGATGVAGVSVSISGPGVVGPGTSVTDANGRFTFTHLTAGNYTIAPTTNGFGYTPVSQIVTVTNSNVSGINFAAAPAFIISGQVVDSTGIGLPGITVKGPQGGVVTDANGQFTLLNYVSGTYTIAPSTPGFLYTPASQSVVVAGANVIGVTFTAAPVFNITGTIVDSHGAGVGGITVVSQSGIVASATTNASGAYVLPGFPAGTYTITPTSPGFIYGPATQTVKVAKADFTGVNFTLIPSVVITSYTLSPYTIIGPGVVTTGTVTINQLAPVGGVAIALSASDLKPARFPSSVTVPAGQSSVTFSVQGNSVSAPATTTLIASYQGPLASQPTSSSTSLTVSPSDTLHVTSATWSKSTLVLQVSATSTNAQAIIAVLNANGNVPLGAMTNLGGGNYNFQTTTGSISSISLKSNLGGSTGQGVSVVP